MIKVICIDSHGLVSLPGFLSLELLCPSGAEHWFAASFLGGFAVFSPQGKETQLLVLTCSFSSTCTRSFVCPTLLAEVEVSPQQFPSQFLLSAPSQQLSHSWAVSHQAGLTHCSPWNISQDLQLVSPAQ